MSTEATIPSLVDAMVASHTGAIHVTREEADHYDLPERNIHEIVYSSKMGAKTFGFHIGELEANSRGGTHRHMCEAMIYIVKGSGHTVVNYEEKIEWKAGDGIYVPAMAWHSHHTNDEPVQFLGMWNVPLMESMGMYFIEEAGDSGATDAKAIAYGTLSGQYEGA